MTVLFFYGTLRHLPLLQQVLGREVAVEAAALPGHTVARAEAGDWPTLVPLAGALASGSLMRDATDSDLERLHSLPHFQSLLQKMETAGTNG